MKTNEEIIIKAIATTVEAAQAMQDAGGIVHLLNKVHVRMCAYSNIEVTFRHVPNE